MDRTELEKYIRNHYGTEPDHPWIKHPNYGVFRHSSKKGMPGADENKNEP